MAAGAVALDAPVDTGASDMSFEQELGATISGAVESVVEPDAQPAQVATEEIPGGEAPTTPSAPATPAAEAPPGEAGAPYSTTPDGANFIIPKAHFESLRGVQKFANAVQDKFQTLNQVNEAYVNSVSWKRMQSDYLNGQEPDLDAVLGYLSGKDARDANSAAQFQQSFVKMAERFPNVLKSVNSEAYDKLGDGIMNSRIENAYQHAATTGEKDDLLAAQRLDWGWTGQYKTELPKIDPIKARQAQLDERNTSLQTREEQMLGRDWNNFASQTLDGPKWNSVRAEIDRTLKPVEGNFANQPMILKALKTQILNEVQAGINKDYDFTVGHNNDHRNLKADFNRLWKQGQTADVLRPRVQAYQNDFKARAARLLPPIVKDLLKSATANAVAQNQPGQKTASPQAPPPANGKTAQQAPYHYSEDPEFTSMFRAQ